MRAVATSLVAVALTLLVATPSGASDTPGVIDHAFAVAPTKGEGVYSAPIWLPLHRNVDDAEVKVGCTYRSFGSDHGYACEGHHDRWAIDFIADAGTPVYAAGAGFATNLTGQPGGSGFGNVVRIDHGGGSSTIYAHLTDVLIPPQGAWVDPTTQVGTVGSTGSASTAHLHYERFVLPTPDADIGDQVSVDPGPLLACRGALLVSYPEIAGFDTWEGLSWGSLTVASDGQGCAQAPPPAADPGPDAPDQGATGTPSDGAWAAIAPAW